MDGNRNDARIRGNAHQLHEKYKNLARDAAQAGDRILAEYYLQHADHYYRVLAEFRPRDEQRPRNQSDDQFDGDGDEDGGDPMDMTPQGFGASAAVQAFGVNATHGAEAAPASRDDDDDSDGDDASPAATQAADSAEADAGEAEDAPRRRGRRGRGRGRPRTNDAAEAAGAEPASEG